MVAFDGDVLKQPDEVQKRGDEFFLEPARSADVLAALVANRTLIENLVFGDQAVVEQQVTASPEGSRLHGAIDALVVQISQTFPEASPIRARISEPNTGVQFIVALKQGDAAAHAEFRQLLEVDPELAAHRATEERLSSQFTETATRLGANKKKLEGGLMDMPGYVVTKFADAEVANILSAVRNSTTDSDQIILKSRTENMQPALDLLATLSEHTPDTDELSKHISELIAQLPGNNDREYPLTADDKEVVVHIGSQAELLRRTVLRQEDIEQKDRVLGSFVGIDTIPKIEAAKAVLPDARLLAEMHANVATYFQALRAKGYADHPNGVEFELRNMFGVDPLREDRLLLLGSQRFQFVQEVKQTMRRSSDDLFKANAMNRLEQHLHEMIEDQFASLQAFGRSCDGAKQFTSYDAYAQDSDSYQAGVTAFEVEVRSGIGDYGDDKKIFRFAPFQRDIENFLGSSILLVERLKQATVHTVQQPELQNAVAKLLSNARIAQASVVEELARVRTYCSEVSEELRAAIQMDTALNRELDAIEQKIEAHSRAESSLPVHMLLQSYEETVANDALLEPVRRMYLEFSQSARPELSVQQFSDDTWVNAVVHTIVSSARSQFEMDTDIHSARTAFQERMNKLERKLEKKQLQDRMDRFLEVSENQAISIEPIGWKFLASEVQLGFAEWQKRKKGLEQESQNILTDVATYNQATQDSVEEQISHQAVESHREAATQWLGRINRIESEFQAFITQRAQMAEKILQMSRVQDVIHVIDSDEYRQFFRMQVQAPGDDLVSASRPREDKFKKSSVKMYPGLVQAAIQMFGPQWRKNNFIGAAFSQDFSMPDYLRIALPIVADRDVQRPERERSVAESFVQRLSQDSFTSYEEIKQVLDQAIDKSLGAYAPDISGHPEVTLQEIRTSLDFLAQRPVRIDAKPLPFAVHDYFISQRLSAACDAIPGLSKKAFELYQQRPDQQLARKLLDENQYARNFVGFVIDLQELDDHVKLYREDEQVFFTAGKLAEALVALQNEPEKFTKNYLLLKTVISQEAVEQLLQKALDGDGFSHPVVRVAARLLRQWFVFDSKKQ